MTLSLGLNRICILEMILQILKLNVLVYRTDFCVLSKSTMNVCPYYFPVMQIFWAFPAAAAALSSSNRPLIIFATAALLVWPQIVDDRALSYLVSELISPLWQSCISKAHVSEITICCPIYLLLVPVHILSMKVKST